MSQTLGLVSFALLASHLVEAVVGSRLLTKLALCQTRLAYSRVWHQISASKPHQTLTTQPDVTPPSLGRLASRIAVLLMGKHKPIWDPSTDCGDYVVVTNCAALHTTGRKMWRKSYYRHTTRPGSLKELTMDALMEKHGGGEVLRKAVRGMLPKNRLRDKRLARLKAFEGDAHPYKDNLVRFGGVVVGSEGWQQAVEKIRESDKKRL
ncbi:ribosomal protein L13, partial [Metarhizium brunneum ARSEF 3297]